MKTINNKLIRSFNPCYDPSEKGIPDDETLTVHEWVSKYKDVVPISDILWLLLRNDFYTDKQLRLFAVWCAREALKMVDNPDQRSINACDIAERYANGKATAEELDAARVAAWDAARATALVAAWAAAWASACDAARVAVWAATEKQLNYLLTL